MPKASQRCEKYSQDIDDTLVPRTAKTGPGISVKHDHARMANRPTLLNTQCWVTLALVVRVRLGSVIAIARFLKGLPVRAVWCEMRQDDGTWSRPRLILATETGLSGHDVVAIYAERWGIEPLFHNLNTYRPLFPEHGRIVTASNIFQGKYSYNIFFRSADATSSR